MASENARRTRAQDADSTSENRKRDSGRRRGAAPTPLTPAREKALSSYAAALRGAPLSAATARTYLSKVRQYLAWLADADVDGRPLTERAARDWAVRDYRSHLLSVRKHRPATINNALAAIDDFYTRRGLGPAAAARLDVPAQAPKALDPRAALRWLRAVQAHPAARDRVLALLPFYAGLRIAEAVALDVDDVGLSARKGSLRVHGKGDKIREVPLHPQLRTDLQRWLDERPHWPDAGATPALLPNRRGGRLSTRAASDIFRDIAQDAGLDDAASAHVGRHTFATTLIRGGTDLVVVAELLGHARLETVRIYTRPTAEDRAQAVDLLPTDR
ncbi:MAG: integrase [Pseudonocardiales bacterium]|nr:MAG: integrase [Pseudonocardiales bacterium]